MEKQVMSILVEIDWDNSLSSKELLRGKERITDTVKFKLNQLNDGYIGIKKATILITSNLMVKE